MRAMFAPENTPLYPSPIEGEGNDATGTGGQP
jgi:hypothetical protein